MRIEVLFGHCIHKLGFFMFTMKNGLEFLGTVVFASPPVLGTLRPSTDGHIVGLGSPPLLARKWTHRVTEYLIELVKERIESCDTTVF